MQVQNQVNVQDKRLSDALKKIFEQMYRQQLSEAIKRGIQAKKLQKSL